ncbi:MAG: glycosyltransferase [Terriglobales bacterium]
MVEQVTVPDPTLAESSGSLHVLTLTPFYPTAMDDAKGCFVAEPLHLTSNFGISHTVVVAEPFYRPYSTANRRFPAQRTRYVSLPGGLGLPTGGLSLYANLLSMTRDLRSSNRIDVIHAHAALPCGHAAALLARELGIPFAITVHGLDAYFTRQVAGPARKWCEKVSKFVYKSAKSVVCISERVRDQVLERAQERVKTEVVYNGVDLEKFRPDGPDPADQIILCVGDLIPSKGQELLLRAFASLHAKFPAASCEVIGEGPERSRLIEISAQLGLAGKIRFSRRCNREEMAEAMRRCALFALPSGYEGLGCVYLEAMASGKVAIGCREQGIEEIIEHGVNGWLIRPGDLEDLTRALYESLANPHLRADLGREARRTVAQRHTLAHQAEQLSRIYRDCAQ